MKHLVIILSLIVFVSCTRKTENQDLNKTFISSYKELTGECLDTLIKVLEPVKLEDENFKISHIYLLDVKLDSTIYSKNDLRFNRFIGVELKPDSFELAIFNINLNLGTIANCEILGNENLIINNMNLLFTDLSGLGGNCFGIDKSLVEHTKGSSTKFRQVAWTNTIYGEWKPELDNGKKFSNSLFDNLWVFKPEKEILFLDSNNDTLLVDSIELKGESLTLMNSGNTFDILTQTKTKILIKEPDTGNVITLTKRND